jgi:isoleucyl-tRNA synthetase
MASLLDAPVVPEVSLATKFSFPEQEELVLDRWQRIKIYDLVRQKSQDGPDFRFMDGPPFVSSDNLHHGHLLVAFGKSSVNNWMAMHGYNVLNKIGYDCHGLPIEMVVNNKLGVHTKQEVETYGIDRYNATCRDTIDSFSGAWHNIYDRCGRWVDYDNEYKTMDPGFMESVWSVFKKLWDKDLVYRGYKVMPYSTGCNTPLSNFEANNDTYKEVNDPSVYVKFQIKFTEDGTEPKYFIVWTTTPWTLPSNLAICVNPEIEYVDVLDKERGNVYVLAKDCLSNLYPQSKKKKASASEDKPYTILKTYMGSDLKDVKYYPVFNHFSKGRTFRVLNDSFVTAQDGTGIVHLAPTYGEDDMNVCIKNGVLTIDQVGKFGPIDDNGMFICDVNISETDTVKLEGVYFGDANDLLIAKMKEHGSLVKKVMHKHNYPHCWRTCTPLMYRAQENYFIKVTALKDQLLANNEKVNWVPGHIGTGRFKAWLDTVRDWGVSRSRFFGTPLPIWVSDDGEEMVCVGSIDELVELANIPKDQRPNDLHREFIDHIQIPSQMGKGMLKRVEYVFDCWFESGSVPYAQGADAQHSEGADAQLDFKQHDYISDFICEGVDQTRGWFYTLMVLSTALYNKPAFKNVICSGLVLADDGKKMSKSKMNFTPVMDVLHKFGADAFRLYLLSSPAIKAGSFAFKDDDVGQINRKFVQLVNGVKFFIEHMTKLHKDGYTFDIHAHISHTNVMDNWIMARTSTMIQHFEDNMAKLKLDKIWPEMSNYIEDLTNWYIKFNRNRLKGRNCTKSDQQQALSTLYHVLITYCKACCPFSPFLTETLYQQLKAFLPGEQLESVHLHDYPKSIDFMIDGSIERKMKRLQDVADMVRSMRSKSDVTTVKMPINQVTICHNDKEFLSDLMELERYMKEELNSLTVTYRDQEGLVQYKCEPNHKAIGKRFRRLGTKVKEALADLDPEVVQDYHNGVIDELTITVEDTKHILTRDEVNTTVEMNVKTGDNEMALLDNGVLVITDFKKTPLIMELYRYRLYITTVQGLRKATNLRPWNKIKIYYDTKDSDMLDMLGKYREELKEELLYYSYPIGEYDGRECIANEKCDISDVMVGIVIVLESDSS